MEKNLNITYNHSINHLTNMKISIIGTGYVGLVTAVGLSELGHQVWAVNRTPEKIEKLKRGELIYYEPGLAPLLKRNLKRRRLHFTNDFALAINNSDFVFICVGTPSRKDGGADLSQIKYAAKQIVKSAKKNLIIIDKSTVPVGTGRLVKKILNKNHHKFEIVSCPEFLREGKAMPDFFHGDRIVVGADSKKIAQKVMKIFAKLKCVKMITDLETAEMIKYASNAFLATKISYINEIANVCEKLGANVDEVARGMGYDRRINPYFLKAGIGYGGSCFPKDVKALKQIAVDINYNFRLLKAVTEVNNQQRKLVVKKAKEMLGNLSNKVVTVLGLAFKDSTDDIRESAAIDIVKWLSQAGAKVKVYDPQAGANAARKLKNLVQFCNNPYLALTASELLIIATEWPMFKDLNWLKVKKLMKKRNIIDGKNLLDVDKIKKLGFKYVGIGR